MLDTPIIVSDEEIKEDLEGKSCYFPTGNKIQIAENGWYYVDCKKIIAGLSELPSIDFNRFEEQLGIVDVEKLSIEHCKPDYDKFGGELEYVERQYWIRGFQAAQKLNEKKFSLEDMANLWQFIVDGAKQLMLSGTTEVSSFDDYIKSLQQPKTYPIKVKIEKVVRLMSADIVEKENWVKIEDSEYTYHKPKITNNRIKITKIL